MKGVSATTYNNIFKIGFCTNIISVLSARMKTLNIYYKPWLSSIKNVA